MGGAIFDESVKQQLNDLGYPKIEKSFRGPWRYAWRCKNCGTEQFCEDSPILCFECAEENVFERIVGRFVEGIVTLFPGDPPTTVCTLWETKRVCDLSKGDE